MNDLSSFGLFDTADHRAFDVDFSHLLAATETLSGTPTVEIVEATATANGLAVGTATKAPTLVSGAKSVRYWLSIPDAAQRDAAHWSTEQVVTLRVTTAATTTADRLQRLVQHRVRRDVYAGER